MTEARTRFVDRASADIGSPGVAALQLGARRLVERRVAGSSEYEPMEAMRDRARAVRMHTLAHLDEYLVQFADAVAAKGGTVHWAGDAAEATQVVRDLATSRGVQTAVKSKSMVTEEIELNHEVEADGVQVVETDLGEFIVQLSGDRPSHIIAPIMHKTRQDVGHLFADELDVEYTDEPEALNAVARAHLRRIFLSADMGISGVNFAVAESGSICLVTNEGNGRLTTTAPAIHVAVMGMERIVPTFGDLAVMLEVLGRSATGQRLSTYTNIVTGPRRPGDPDGPDELHVVIVDNGRGGVLGGTEAEILGCIRCGACLNICPVYRTTGGHAYGGVYSGPIGAVLTPAKDGLEQWGDLADASSLCGACLEACPVRLDIPAMLLRVRSQATDAGHREAGVRRAVALYAAAATRPAAFRALLRMGGWVGRVRGWDGWVERIPGPGRAWTDYRDLPAPARRSFHDRWRRRRGT